MGLFGGFIKGFKEGWNETWDEDNNEILESMLIIKKDVEKAGYTKSNSRAYFNDRTLLQSNNIMVTIYNQYDLALNLKEKSFRETDVEIVMIECRQTENYLYIDLYVHINETKTNNKAGKYCFNF